jgi:hypothetical protein
MVSLQRSDLWFGMNRLLPLDRPAGRAGEGPHSPFRIPFRGLRPEGYRKIIS